MTCIYFGKKDDEIPKSWANTYCERCRKATECYEIAYSRNMEETQTRIREG